MSLTIKNNSEIEINGDEKEILENYEMLGKEICEKFEYDYSKLLLMMMCRYEKLKNK